MDEQNSLNTIALRQFFNYFQHIRYRDVSICQFVYRDIMTNWTPGWIKENHPDWETKISQLKEAEIYKWADEPYLYAPHPDSIILMRGGFGDLASLFLKPNRFFLISPSKAEVDLIKLNRPDLVSHNIADYYRENSQAIEKLIRQIVETTNEQKDFIFPGVIELSNWVQKRVPDIVRMLDAVYLLFETMNIGAVLTVSSTYSMDGALNMVAKAKHIPSLTLQHGLIAERDLFAHIPILTTKKMVWGNAIRKWYQKFGYPESRISVIGSPRFDIIFNRDWCGKEKLRMMLGIDPSIKVVVYGADIIRIDELIVPVLLEGLRSLPGIYLVMLQHPGENPEPHEKLAAGYPNGKVVRFGHISLYDALSGAELFITSFSTSALEAMFFKLPVVTIEPAPPTFSFGDLGASLKVTNAGELNQTVKQLLSDPDFKNQAIERYQDFLLQYCIPDGLASKRLFEEVENLCRNGGIA